MTIPDTLAARGSRYGAFLPNAQVSDALNQVVTADAGYQRLSADQREALRQIFLKVSRIVTGDPNYDDNWRDIAGYAQLILNRLTPPTDPGPAETEPEPTTTPEQFARMVNNAAHRTVALPRRGGGVTIGSDKLIARPGDVVHARSGVWSVSRAETTTITWLKDEPPKRMIEKIKASGGKATHTYDGTGRVALYCSPDGTSGIVFLEPGDAVVKDSGGIWVVQGPDATTPAPAPEPAPKPEPEFVWSGDKSDEDAAAAWLRENGAPHFYFSKFPEAKQVLTFWERSSSTWFDVFPGDTIVKKPTPTLSVNRARPEPETETVAVTEQLTFTVNDTVENVANWINAHGGTARADNGAITLADGRRFYRGQTIRKTRKGNWKIT